MLIPNPTNRGAWLSLPIVGHLYCVWPHEASGLISSTLTQVASGITDSPESVLEMGSTCFWQTQSGLWACGSQTVAYFTSCIGWFRTCIWQVLDSYLDGNIWLTDSKFEGDLGVLVRHWFRSIGLYWFLPQKGNSSASHYIKGGWLPSLIVQISSSMHGFAIYYYARC